jgi:hypothetical protein
MTTTTDPIDDVAVARQLQALINGSWIAQACYVTAGLGIAELLAEGPRRNFQSGHGRSDQSGGRADRARL